MEAEKSSHYFSVFAALAILTAIEVGVIYLPILKLQQVFLLVSLALCKALLVALYYMHLKFERLIPTIFIALSPLLLILQAVALVLLGISWRYS